MKHISNKTPKPALNQRPEPLPGSDRLTPAEIESLRQEGLRALREMTRGREHLIV